MAQQLVFYLTRQLSEEHVEPIGVPAPQRLLDALPMVFEVGDLVIAFLHADSLRYLGPALNDPDNLMQNRRIHPLRRHL